MTALTWEQAPARASGGRTIATFRTRLPDDYIYFEGHFPTYPVLAGVVQLHELVLPCLRRARPDAGALESLTGIKFPKRIRPGDTLEVVLAFVDGTGAVEFEIARAGERCTQGRLTVALLTCERPG